MRNDQVVPIQAVGLKSAKLLPQEKLKIYRGGSHAIYNINIGEVDKRLLGFLLS